MEDLESGKNWDKWVNRSIILLCHYDRYKSRSIKSIHILGLTLNFIVPTLSCKPCVQVLKNY